MSQASPQFSIIIPVYNEQARLERALQDISQYAADHKDIEILMVDDGSKDQTGTIIGKYLDKLPIRYLKQDRNYGKGWAVRAGMLQAAGQYCAFLDADMATPIDQVDKLFASLQQGNDVAIGSRITAEGVDLRLVGQKPQPPIRQFLGKAFRLFATRPFLGNIRDSQCGAKAFTSQAAQTLFSQQTIKRWSFDIEILFLAKKMGYQVAEIPVNWSTQDDSKLQPSLSLAVNIIKELLSIVWIHRSVTAAPTNTTA